MRRTLIALVGLTWIAQVDAQTVHRCVDAAGHVYYFGAQPPAGVKCVEQSQREMPSAPPEPTPIRSPNPTNVGPVPAPAPAQSREPRKRLFDPEGLRSQIRKVESFSLADCLAKDTTFGGRFVRQSQQKRAEECAVEERRLKSQAEDARQWLREQGDKE